MISAVNQALDAPSDLREHQKAINPLEWPLSSGKTGLIRYLAEKVDLTLNCGVTTA